ncbi:hypothetical protein [Streptomyces scabiei]|uniref:hypothetical protein n=1 Tax=Streptomyces scabiei TaxID=1930 RepID=UPI0029BE934E|nr:hypothetical protein [Streptomyces scabiei]MDX3206100.1 hypothetical protein [Streptomyces scabiei]
MVFTVVHESQAGDSAIDLQTIALVTNEVLAMELSTSTREGIDRNTARVIGFLGLLLAEDLGAEGDAEVMKLYRMAYAHLDMPKRPTRLTTTYTAFEYMRDTGVFVQALMKVYAQRNGHIVL